MCSGISSKKSQHELWVVAVFKKSPMCCSGVWRVRAVVEAGRVGGG